jgi:hypothetical protein
LFRLFIHCFIIFIMTYDCDCDWRLIILTLLRVYFFRMSGMCRTCSSEWSGTEHSARTNRTVCGVYHVLRWCRRNQFGRTHYLFFYIEFFYTLLIFLKLCNTK